MFHKSTVRCGHAEATACTAASVMLLQLSSFSDVSCLHPEATATTASSAMLLQLFRLSDVSCRRVSNIAAEGQVERRELLAP